MYTMRSCQFVGTVVDINDAIRFKGLSEKKKKLIKKIIITAKKKKNEM